MSLGRPQPPARVPTMPTGDAIACYPTYLEAQQAIDYLADQHFGIEALTIVGTDLRSVERVTGRLSYGRVAVAGAMSGAWFGLFVGLLLSLFGGTGFTHGIIFIAIGLGAGFGLLFSVLSYALGRGKRDFTSQSQTVAGSYTVLCAEATAAQARHMLLSSALGVGQVAPGLVAPPPPPPPPLAPPVEQVLIIEQPTLASPVPVALAAPAPADAPTGPPAATGPPAPAEADSRWTLPNGLPRYGALATEPEVQAALAQNVVPEPDVGLAHGAASSPDTTTAQRVVPEPPAGPSASPSPMQNVPPGSLGQSVVVEPQSTVAPDVYSPPAPPADPYQPPRSQ